MTFDAVFHRITYGMAHDYWINEYGIKESDRFSMLLLELYFPCGAPLGDSSCDTPESGSGIENKWKHTVFRFALQVASQDARPCKVIGKVNSVKPCTWDCNAAKPAPLAWCGGAAAFEGVDGIVREAVAHARFEVAEALATGESVKSTLDACQDDTSFQYKGETKNCDTVAMRSDNINQIDNWCWNTEFGGNTEIALNHCEKKCQGLANPDSTGSTGYC